MGWQRPLLTDSGGFQVFSLPTKVSEEGVRFASPINGDRLTLTPEESMRIQKSLNADVVMVFDECTAYPATEKQAKKSMELSMRWAARSKRAHEATRMRCLGVQGIFRSLKFIFKEHRTAEGEAHAIGRAAVGKPAGPFRIAGQLSRRAGRQATLP
jgi:queuine tRNA-ribosyltransferase